MKKLQNRKGFTLVELLIVMAIIAILILIALPRFAQSTSTATYRTLQGNARTLASACQVYYADNNAWPTKISDLTTASKYADITIFGADGTTNTKPTGAQYTIGGTATDQIVATIVLDAKPGKIDAADWADGTKTATARVAFK
ncbi:MAG: prepilin-type N-terminal cleavage/methylation domain-containing protein [Peptostreptococcaceae bacterium]|nr:prepilin-type N-terminal cleavage/methylation domain-containing protein [Peptostreptococcaceae bacterium]